MKIRHKMSFEIYPDKAIQLMLDTAVGKPFRDADGKVIGEIKEVSRTENPRVLEFVTEVFEGGEIFDTESKTVVSIDTARKSKDA